MQHQDNLESLINKIINNEEALSEEIVKAITYIPFEARHIVCARLAEAFLLVKNKAQQELAMTFAQRALDLSNYSEEHLALYERVFAENKQPQKIKIVYKKLGLKSALDGDWHKSLKYFNLWQNTYVKFAQQDHYEYDPDVYAAIQNLALPYLTQYSAKSRQAVSGRKIRLTYLTTQADVVNSIIFKLTLVFAKNYDQTCFEISIAVPESIKQLQSTDAGQKNLVELQSLGVPLFFLEETLSPREALHELSAKITAFGADILLTFAAMSDLKHFYLTQLRPAPRIVALQQGPPAQFVHSSFDAAIAWTNQMVIDCPTQCHFVPIEVDLPEPNYVGKLDRKQLNLDKNDFVIFIGGRTQKFHNHEFWSALNTVLASKKNIKIIAIGPLELQLKFVSDIVEKPNYSRIQFLGWRTDYLDLMYLSDLVIDTYPSGGGILLHEAMGMCKPFIGYQNNPLQAFDQVHWSPIIDNVKDRSLIINRGDWRGFVDTVRQCIKDTQWARAIARTNQDHAYKSFSNPARMVSRCENILKQISCSASTNKPTSQDADLGHLKDTTQIEVESWRVDLSRREEECRNHLRVIESEYKKLDEYFTVREQKQREEWDQLYKHVDIVLNDLKNRQRDWLIQYFKHQAIFLFKSVFRAPFRYFKVLIGRSTN